jgi:hypothetical protein
MGLYFEIPIESGDISWQSSTFRMPERGVHIVTVYVFKDFEGMLMGFCVLTPLHIEV